MPVAPSLPTATRRTTRLGQIGKQVLERDQKRESIVHKRPCVRKVDVEDSPVYQKLQNSGRMRLESFEGAMRFYFANSDMKLGYMQKRLVDLLIVTALRKFFATDLVANLKYLSTKYMIDDLSDCVSVIFPARYNVPLASFYI